MVDVIKNKIGGNRRNIFWFLAVVLVFSFSFYIYFVSHAVYSVVERGKIEKAIAKTESLTEESEAKYLDLKAKVTIELARAKGFTDITASTYISRKPLGASLSLNNEI